MSKEQKHSLIVGPISPTVRVACGKERRKEEKSGKRVKPPILAWQRRRWPRQKEVDLLQNKKRKRVPGGK